MQDPGTNHSGDGREPDGGAEPTKAGTGHNVRLVYSGRIKKVCQAICKANEILNDPEFYELIRDYKKFGEDLPPEVIAGLMEQNNHVIRVRVNYLMPFSVAYIHSASSVRISYWNFSGDLPTGVNTMIHETVRAISHLHPSLQGKDSQINSYGHTAPWVIGSIAEIMVK